MKVFLDGEPLPDQPAALGEALQLAAVAAERRGRLVVEATVDGEPVSEEWLAAPPEGPVGEELRCVSAEPRSLVRVTLLDASDALESARARQAACAEMIQAGQIAEALEPLGDVLATWSIVRDAVERSAAVLGLRLDGLAIPGPAGEIPARDLIASLADRLQEVRRGLRAEDWSSLADALAYDMQEQVDRWRTLLATMAEQAGGTA